MADIRYVCLSDMHFGEEDSLLTNLSETGETIDVTRPSPVLTKMVQGLRELIKKDQAIKPTLILNGDILELALCKTNEASMAFQRFIELAMDEKHELFKDIIYIPGNHDHHLWELARETQYVNFIKNKNPQDTLKEPWHNTKIFIENYEKAPPSFYLDALVKMNDHLKDDVRKAAGKKEFKVTVAYPNFGLISEDSSKSVLFSHGHYIEPLYFLMSRLRDELLGGGMPKTIWEIEGENFAWVDFFWSTMGRSQGVGPEIEKIYEKMESKKGSEDLARVLAKYIAKNLFWKRTDKLEMRFLTPALHKILIKVLKLEKKEEGKPLSPDAEDGLKKYMEEPMAIQIVLEKDKELKGVELAERVIKNKGVLPKNITFVFGHTHKPFQEIKKFDGYAMSVPVYNTGGWIVESVERNTQHGGSIVLIDEELSTISLNVYKEATALGGSMVEVKEVLRDGEHESVFCEQIREEVNNSKEFWDDLSYVIYEEVGLRAARLALRIASSLG